MRHPAAGDEKATPRAASAADILVPERDTERFIRENLRLAPVPFIPEISLYGAHPGSGLARLAVGGRKRPVPYWAYPWAGGAALARHVLDHPSLVVGKRVLDIGSGSGLVAIAAGIAGASHVTASEIDETGLVALRLNAQVNGVHLSVTAVDLTKAPPPADIDLILAGDVFYERSLAIRMLPFLEACEDQGIAVLVGDPRRTPLPVDRLRVIAEYAVADVGSAEIPSFVFALAPR
jgi:predicted nicotinamide N-methyase